ncbi:MAG: FHA domain-containing protein [Actinomycetota bacterium]|nr:FHA domain-containing protein [Actinomycetota bacterium]
MGLQQFERRLERLVEGVFAKAFRSGLQPVELGRRLTREMDARRAVGVRGVIAPNAFTFALAPADLERFQSFSDAMVRELADAAREHARTEGYVFVGPVEVTLEADESVTAGTFLVAGEVREAPGGGVVGSLVLPDGARVAITDEAVTIGRLSDCDVPVTDESVSRRHAEVRRQGNDVVVVDLGSTNGTKVNGVGVRQRRLADGDEIIVGSTRLRFEAS